MNRFDDINVGDGRWDEVGATEKSSINLKKDLIGEEEEEAEEEEEPACRPGCFSMSVWVIKEALRQGRKVEIPSLGIKIESRK